MQPKKKFVRLFMPNKDLKKYDKGTNFLPMKAEGKARLSFIFLCIFLLYKEILEEVKNLYIFGGRGEF
jgi:hypothetical protein